jgi:CBS domain containing-hemolysin-like protein
MNSLWLLLAAAAALSALCSGAETGLYALNPLKIRHRARVSAGAALLLRALRSPGALLATLLVANNLANDLVVQATIRLLESRTIENAELVAALLLTPLMFLLCDVMPKQWFAQHAEATMPLFAWPLLILRVVLLPLTLPLQGLVRLLEGRREEAAVLGRLEWAALFREGQRTHPGEARVMSAALRAVESRGAGLRPFLRPQVPLLNASATREDGLRRLADCGLGFILVARASGTPALLTGARLLQADPAALPGDLATPLLPLPSGLDLAGALHRLRESGVALAWVTEGAGGFFDLEYALSLLAAPDPVAAGRTVRP